MATEFPLTELPDDLLLDILSHVPGNELVKSCCFVNKKWRDLVNCQLLWRLKCERKRIYDYKVFPEPPDDFKMYYFKNPYSRNLVKNPCAKEMYNHWKVYKNGGDRFTVEEKAVGAHPLGNYTKVPGDIKYWTTSYGWCGKIQTIDLLAEGCSIVILDGVTPDIKISEWYAARFDCRIEYKLKVTLLDKDKKKLDEFKFEDQKPAGRDWYQVEHTFSSYPKGLRYIEYKHKGKDGKFWAGHYGAKFTMSTVKFDLMSEIPQTTVRQPLDDKFHQL